MVAYAQKAEVRKVQTRGFSTFVPNLGQWGDDFQSVAELGYGTFYSNNNGYRILLRDNTTYHHMMDEYHLYKNIQQDHIIKYAAIQFTFEGGSSVAPRYQEPTGWVNHYYHGKDEQNWRSNVQPYYQYIKNNVYPGIHFQHSVLGDYLKTEWHVQPMADASKIQIKVDGADSISIIDNCLVIYTAVGNMIEKAPVAWQIIDGIKVMVKVNFTLKNQLIGFKVDEYRSHYPLIIDPVLVFSTYSGSTSDNFGFTATYDSKGRLYAGGISGKAGGKYPTTLGAFQDTFRGGTNTAPTNLASDITISKYSSDGTQLLYATYLGGSLNDLPHSLVVNSKDELYILGTTFSNDFPVNNGYDTSYNGKGDIVLIHFNEDGSQLRQSTYVGDTANDGLNAPLNNGTIGYNYADDFRGDIVIDSGGNVYVASCTESIKFPTTAQATQKTIGGKRDAVIFSLDSTLRKLRFSTFWGGSNDDAAYSVKINSSGKIYVAGGTASNNFPTTSGAYNTTYQGGRADGFVLALDSILGQVKIASLFGTSEYDQSYFLDIDVIDRVYLAGQTQGIFPRTAGRYGKDRTGQFVACLDSTLSNLVFQTTFGNRLLDPELSPSAFLVDNCYNIYFSGWGSVIGIGHNGTTSGLETKNANWSVTDGSDFYLIVMHKEARGLIYASYIGGTQTADHVDGGTSRFDKNGIVYQSVCASCPPSGISQLSDFPTTPTSVFPTNPSIRCSNASFKLDFQISYSTEAGFNAPNTICQDKLVYFNNTSKGSLFLWDFGDGTTDTAKNPSHQYTSKGSYLVTLISTDSLACNLSDTAINTVTIIESPPHGFEVSYEICNPGIITFKHDPVPNGSITWDLGDGSKHDGNLESYKYAKDGSFKVKQFVALPNGCKDTSEKELIIAANAGGALQIFNVFTPNNDNLNPCWKPEGLNIECEKMETRVYSRYGVRVYDSTKDGDCWNGKIDNTKALVGEGTYYYAIKVFKNNSEDSKEVYGVITVLR